MWYANQRNEARTWWNSKLLRKKLRSNWVFLAFNHLIKWIVLFVVASLAILFTVVQLRVVAETPSLVSIKLFGKANLPFFLWAKLNASRFVMKMTSTSLSGELSGGLIFLEGSSGRKVTNSLVVWDFMSLNGFNTIISSTWDIYFARIPWHHPLATHWVLYEFLW